MPSGDRLVPVIAAAAFCATTVFPAIAQDVRQTFRTSTRLVEVSVVVTDRVGKAVTNLQREDFTLTEDGEPQTISIFQVNDSRALPQVDSPEPVEGPRTFTNVVDQAEGAATVILFDRLNNAFASQWFARRHVDSYLSKSRPGDRFALYVLDGALRVLHDFTTDHQSLRRTLDQYTIRPSARYEASNEPPIPMPEGGLSVWIVDPSGNTAEFFTQRRTWDTFDALRELAGQLSGIAGRKSIVWLSEVFPIPSKTDPEFNFRMRRAVHALSDAQVSVYPVDARGLVGAQTVSSSGRVSHTTFAGVRGNMETMEFVAAETGGRAFTNTNALDVSVGRAVDDSRFTYLLGYYPADTKWDGRFRALSVDVRRKGLIVRHRRGYVAAAAAMDERARTTALKEALRSPLQSTQVGLRVGVERAAGSRMNVSVRIDPATLALERDAGNWRGAVDVLFAEISPKGIGSIAGTEKLGLVFTEEERRNAARRWPGFSRTVTVSPDIFQLRIVARDVASGKVGSVVIPASQLK